MSLFKPDYFFEKIWDISPDFLNENNIKCLLIDVDNTLTTHDNPIVKNEALEWIEKLKKYGITMLVISNNKRERVSSFAQSIDLDFVFDAKKPLLKGVNDAILKTGFTKDEMLIIGDQIFTDVLCGKFSNVRSALVVPFELETMPQFKIKRFFENIILRKERKDK